MPLDFDRYAAKGNEFLNALAIKLGSGSREHAARVLRSVFRVLRNQLTVEESIELLAQLPVVLKGAYVDGWQISKKHKRLKTLEDFAKEVVKEEGSPAWRDFSNLTEVMLSVQAVIETLGLYVSQGEMEDAIGTLPRDIKRIFRDWIPN